MAELNKSTETCDESSELKDKVWIYEENIKKVFKYFILIFNELVKV